MNLALVYNWPGSRNSEFDIIGRIKEILNRENINCHLIDPFGQILDDSGVYREPRERIDESALDFVLNLHYSSPNFMDTYSYFTNWNPVEYLRKDPPTGNNISHEQELYIANCIRTHDVALQAGSDVVNDYYQAINVYNPVYEPQDELIFFTTCQYVEGVKQITLQEPRIFYIGINWERLARGYVNDARHGGLLERLDSSGFTDFYGVTRLRNINLWEGFRNYHGELPFDNGISIIDKSNECGISLVLSSRAHHNSGLISTRIFQACAARTVIISDDNPFIQSHFGDSVIYINFSDDSESNFRQIADAYNWITANKEQAKAKAEKAHQIFREKFTLDKQVKNLLAYHDGFITKQKNNRSDIANVDVIWITRTKEENEIRQFITSLNKQEDINVSARIIMLADSKSIFMEQLEKYASFNYVLHTEEKFSNPTGHYIKKHLGCDQNNGYFCIYDSNTEWLSRHLKFMVKAICDRNELVVQTGGCIEGELWHADYYTNNAVNCVKGYFCPINVLDITIFNFEKYSSSAFLFKKKILNESVMNILANLEHACWYAFVVSSWLETRMTPVFVPRITIRTLSEKMNKQLFSREYQSKTYDDRRFLRLCYSFNTENGEVFGIEKLLRQEMFKMVSMDNFKSRILNRLEEKNGLFHRLLLSFLKFIFKYI